MSLWLLFSALIWHLEFAGEQLTAEVVMEKKERAQGLAGRTELADGSCMLFVYEKAQPLSFWMKGMKIPISIAFFDENKKLIQFEEMSPPPPLTIYKSKQPAKYVLELPAGWFDRHPARKGDGFSIVN